MNIENKKEMWNEYLEEKSFIESSKNLENKLEKRTKGLSLPISNKVLEYYAKPKSQHGKGLKIKQIGRLHSLQILKSQNELNSYVSFKYLAHALDLDLDKTYESNENMVKTKVRKALRDLEANISFKEDGIKGIKITRLPRLLSEGIKIDKGETKGFTQLYCKLKDIEGITNDLIVLYTVLEYFKGSKKIINPSLDTLAELSGCSRRKVVTLLDQGQNLGLWKKISTKGGTKNHTNKYELSYIPDGEIEERYYYLDILEKEQKPRKIILKTVKEGQKNIKLKKKVLTKKKAI